jgi:hypothetical protein
VIDKDRHILQVAFNLLDPSVITVVGERILKGFRLSDGQLKHLPPFLGKHREPGVRGPRQMASLCTTLHHRWCWMDVVAAAPVFVLDAERLCCGRAELPLPMLDAGLRQREAGGGNGLRRADVLRRRRGAPRQSEMCCRCVRVCPRRTPRIEEICNDRQQAGSVVRMLSMMGVASVVYPTVGAACALDPRAS